MNIEKFKRIIVKRAKRLKFDNVYKLIENRPFILAGGALCPQTPNDFDIYPSDGKEFNLNNITNELTTFDKNRVKFITRTKNAHIMARISMFLFAIAYILLSLSYETTAHPCSSIA